MPLVDQVLQKFSTMTEKIKSGTLTDPQHQIKVQPSFKDNFWLKYDLKNGDQIVYLSGHSMGLQPKNTEKKINEVIQQWKI